MKARKDESKIILTNLNDEVNIEWQNTFKGNQGSSRLQEARWVPSGMWRQAQKNRQTTSQWVIANWLSNPSSMPEVLFEVKFINLVENIPTLNPYEFVHLDLPNF